MCFANKKASFHNVFTKQKIQPDKKHTLVSKYLQYATLIMPARRRGTREAVPLRSSILSIIKTAIIDEKAMVVCKQS